MPHRPGHLDNVGDGTLSMDRRKYLNTLAAGAAFSTVAAALAACGSPSSNTSEQPDSDAAAKALAPAAAGCVTFKNWGYLSLFPPGILTIAEAKANMPTTGTKLIRVPFFNSNGIALTERMVVSVHLVRIGCPLPLFAVAFNLEDHDHEIADAEREFYTIRNTNMDIALRKMGLPELAWEEPDGKDCPEPVEDWKYDWPK